MLTPDSIKNFAATILLAGWLGPGCLLDGGDSSDEQAWMSIAPVQCGGNAWEVAGQSLEDYLADLGVDVLDKKSSTWAEAVCLACSCPSGERIDVLVDTDDVAILLDEGFVPEDDWPFSSS